MKRKEEWETKNKRLRFIRSVLQIKRELMEKVE